MGSINPGGASYESYQAPAADYTPAATNQRHHSTASVDAGSSHNQAIEDKVLNKKQRIKMMYQNFNSRMKDMNRKYGWLKMVDKWKLNSGLVLWGGPDLTITERIKGPATLKDDPRRYVK